MKKIILLALTALMVVGCGEYQGEGKLALAGYSDLEIDSCQYIVGYNVLAHKGNCRFCEERDSIKWEKRKKELEELVEQLKENNYDTRKLKEKNV